MLQKEKNNTDKMEYAAALKIIRSLVSPIVTAIGEKDITAA
jgi:hypothetical protein